MSTSGNLADVLDALKSALSELSSIVGHVEDLEYHNGQLMDQVDGLKGEIDELRSHVE